MEQSIKKCPLFTGIAEEQLTSLFDCLTAKRHRYKKDEFIFRADDRAVFVGVVVSGGANIIQEDFWGNRTILAHVVPGELFGEAFSCAETEKLPVSVIATEASDIMLIDYRKIATVCSSSCVFHTRLIANMMRVLAGKNIMLTRKMEYVSKRTTREKILAFLSAQAVQAKRGDITIPFNRQELADYLCVERSALSRVLMQMKEDGILDYDKNRFTLK
ncbi:Crp/Fnr family transcriptional regulator [Oscillospiraceae bacterium OttesenSCG-928-G22]|nr:Crp/Fnr family transcriptional regulator [Oscillospiraceae bacterium OttesenSCG-928-G22]